MAGRRAGHLSRHSQRETIMQLGALIPLGDIGGEASVVRDYAQAVEAMGYDFLEAPDHVLGVNAASRSDWDMSRNTSKDLFHDPFVLFGFLAGCTTKLGFSTGVLILPQRQTVLVAKQAASLDVLCGGRFRLGIGVGWNEVEFVGLNENFRNRGRRSEEQVQVMQALWKQDHVTFKGRYHTIDDAGINPRPPSGRVPIWFGGHHDATLPRIARWGDGWMPNAYPPDHTALEVMEKLRGLTRAEGRNPNAVGIEVWTSCGTGKPADWRKEVAFWKSAGASHICLTTTFNRRHHHRVAGRTAADHLAAMRTYRDAVSDAL
jgi:probable F420-dependent oxidoreductase